MGKILFIFVDGLGLAPEGECNPFSKASTPFLRNLLGGPLTLERIQEKDGLVLRALDAKLGVEGIPQSATGQTALFTGINAPALVNAHLHAWPTGLLVDILKEQNFLKKAREEGFKVIFANAYTPFYFELVESGKRPHSATSWLTISAEIPFRTLEDLRAGKAVYWDIVHEYLVNYLKIPGITKIEPEEAGRNLARLTEEYDLVLFETFLLDLAGHRKLPWSVEETLDLFDRFLSGIMEAPSFTLVLSSDHGNVEDDCVKVHTANPVPLLAIGPQARLFSRCQAITDVAGAVLEALRTP
ncbi:MAG: hypothetical protein RMK30_02365 [Anaerolineae bacterium]|nr:hypothetical protein [Anaerolineae bacterium]MDW8101705.1 hypothetical protein [Anaerolineae bacterium]